MDNKLNIVTGNNIGKFRLKSGMSQEELAWKAGLHRTYIGGIERGERNITLNSSRRERLSAINSYRNIGGENYGNN
jgi:transcriptional regulator with XRE-family HTH domain